MIDVTQADVEAAVDAVNAIVGNGFVVGCCAMSPTDGHEFAAYLSNAFGNHREAAYAAGVAAERERTIAMIEALQEADSLLGHVYNKVCLRGFLSDPSDRIINALEQIRATIAAAGGE